MRGRVAELVLPALRWNAAEARYDCEGGTLDEALALGVGGFCFFGGPVTAAQALIADLRARSRVRLLIAADLERGAGQQFDGLTGLPPLAALGSLGDASVMRRAGEITAAEACAIGVNWVFAPVLDLDVEPDNPIVGTRAIGSDPDTVGRLGAAWIEGCQSQGVLACAKHFPGHGRTTADSHATLPVVTADRDTLIEQDVAPFRAACNVNVAAIMSCHVAFPALDSSGAPATMSRPILGGLLRRDLAFSGLVVTDAMIMEGLFHDDPSIAGEGQIAIRSLNAGVDLLLYPRDTAAVHAALAQAVDRRSISVDALHRSLARRESWVAWTSEQSERAGDAGDIDAWASDIRQRVIHTIRGTPPRLAPHPVLQIIDDDIGGPYAAPSRQPLVDALEARIVEGPSAEVTVIAVFGDIRSWKGRPGYSADTRAAIEVSTAAAPGAVVVQFSHPRLATQVAGSHVVCAWGGEESMQRAAGAWLRAR